MTYLSQAHLTSLRQDKPSAYAELMRTHVPLGLHPKTGDTLFQPQVDRYMATYGIGVTGTGKTRWMEGPILHDCVVGNAVIFLDPNGDAVNHLVAAMPAHCASRVSVLDLDEADRYPFGLNMFSLSGTARTQIEREQAAARIEHVFNVLWPETTKQANMSLYLPAIIEVFLDNPGATLLDMIKFLGISPEEKAYRAKLLSRVTDPITASFWRTHNALGDKDQVERVRALVTRLGQLFMGRGTIQNVLGQRRTTISFRHAIENREIILIKLPIRQSTKNAEIIGTILLAQITAAIFSFSNVPESQRPGVSVYVDEVQNFASEDFKALIAEARKFGARITIAHQWRSQLPDFMRDATMTARTKVVFQTSPEDSREMATLFPAQGGAVKPSSGMDTTLLRQTSDFPHNVQVFVYTYLSQLKATIKGGVVDLGDHMAVDWKRLAIQSALWGAKSGIKAGVGKQNQWFDDPTDRFNVLLYECMTSGHAYHPIPWEVAVGFCMTGGGFYKAVRPFQIAELMPDYEMPAHLVYGGMWTHKPESARERLLHFVYHLRQTMEYLAAHPVGKASTASNNVVAEWISHLPRRMAYVRLGDEVGMITTLDSAPELTGAALTQRWDDVRSRTHARYCHTVAQVEKVLDLAPDKEPEKVESADVGEIAGWGQVGEP